MSKQEAVDSRGADEAQLRKWVFEEGRGSRAHKGKKQTVGLFVVVMPLGFGLRGLASVARASLEPSPRYCFFPSQAACQAHLLEPSYDTELCVGGQIGNFFFKEKLISQAEL